MKLVTDKLVPNAKGLPVKFPLPKLDKAADLRGALGAILKAVSRGRLTPEEAQAVAVVMNALGIALTVEDLEKQMEERA